MLGPLLEVEISKKCMPLWRKARFQVKCTKHNRVGPLLEVVMSKKCMPFWREAYLQVKKLKTPQVRSTFGSWDVKKVHAVVARSTFPNQKCKKLTGMEHVWTFRCCFAWQAQGIGHLVKSEKTWRFSSISKNDGRRGTFEEDLERCISRGRRSTRDMFIRDVRRSGRWFPETGCILEHQILSFGKMILCDTCSTLYDLASFFLAGAILQRHGLENRKTQWYETVSSAFNFRLLKEVLQNCFLFDVIMLKSWGSPAELLRFQACRLQIDRQTDRQLQLPLPQHYTTHYKYKSNYNYATLHNATPHGATLH